MQSSIKYLVYHDGDNRWKVQACIYRGEHKQTGLPLILTPDWDAGPRVVGREFLFDTYVEASASLATRKCQ